MKDLEEKNGSGFSLLEVVIALLILSVGILGAAKMQISSIQGNSQANRITEASTVGSDRMERLILAGYDDAALANTVPAGTDVDDALSDISTAHIDTSPPENYEVFWNVAENFPVEDCKTIRVLVRRDDKGTLKLIAQNFSKMRFE